jgi:hypothetical protein
MMKINFLSSNIKNLKLFHFRTISKYCFSSSNKNDFFHLMEDPTKPKFSKNLNKNPEHPSEEENLTNLIKDLRSFKDSNHIEKPKIIQKDDIIFISNLDEQFKSLKLGEIIQINNKSLAQCISLKENLVTCILLNRDK